MVMRGLEFIWRDFGFFRVFYGIFVVGGMKVDGLFSFS